VPFYPRRITLWVQCIPENPRALSSYRAFGDVEPITGQSDAFNRNGSQQVTDKGPI